MREMNIKIKTFNSEKTFDKTDQNKEEQLKIIAQIKLQVLQKI